MRYSQLAPFVLAAICIFSQFGSSQDPGPIGSGRLPDVRTPPKSMLPPMGPRKEYKLRDKVTDKEAEKVAREAEKHLAELRLVNPQDLDTYRSFLKNKHSGIFKLFPNMGCFSKTLIHVDGDCTGVIPNNSDYSFLKRDYWDGRFHDIGFFKDEIVSRGYFSQGVLVSLKGTPIEDVTLARDELTFLSSLKPSHTFAEARKTALEFDDGVLDKGNSYASHLKVAENTTYGLRLIAYHVPDEAWSANSLNMGVSEHHFSDLFPRADLMVVLRVIRQDPDGVLTIVWRELDRQKSPKIKFAKGEEVVDFRGEQK